MALTKVNLLHEIDFDISYDHSRSFDTRTEQESYFLSKIPSPTSRYSKDNLTYQRKDQYIDWGENIETLFNVSYLMFQNADFGTKWFYGFITRMEYVNKNNTRIYFEVDDVQTWLLFDIEVPSAFIERQHVADDTFGLHLVDEGLAVGNYVTKDYDTVPELDDITYVMASTVDPYTLNDVFGQRVTGNYTGITYFCDGTAQNETWLNAMLSLLNLGGKTAGVQHIFTMPLAFVNTDPITDVVVQPEVQLVSFTSSFNFANLDGYVPKNKKMFSFPYNFIELTDHKSRSNIYRYEMFGGSVEPTFIASCEVSPSPTVLIHPFDYRGSFPGVYYAEPMMVDGYPVCAFVTDFYTNWFAQNQAGIAFSGVTAAAGGIAAAATGNVAGAVGAFASQANLLGSMYQAAIKPNEMKGTPSGAGNLAIDKQNAGIFRKTITAEYARIIDDMFTRYGYKVNSLEAPVLKTRLAFNYFKFQDMVLTGNVSNEIKANIMNIFKKGITFWHNDNIGDYSQSNTPIGGGGSNPIPDPEPPEETGNTEGFLFPLDGPYALTSSYGERIHPITGDPDFHYGVDLAANVNTPILSVLDGGTVTEKGYNSSMGNYVFVDYSYNSKTYRAIYMHMVSTAYVSLNQVIDKGHIIGGVGTTGSSTGNHLHFGLKEDNVYVDPWLFINPGL